MKSNDVVAKYLETEAYGNILVHKLGPDEDDPRDYVVIEAPADGLRFLADILLSLADNQDDSCHWDFDPRGVGRSWFDKRSNKGIYLHRLPCDRGTVRRPFET